MDMVDSVENATETRPTARLPLNKACEACRFQKVRCLLDNTSPSPQCQRCVKGNRPCVFAPAQRKRPRQRTYERVAELEREVGVMRSLLKKGGTPIAESKGEDNEIELEYNPNPEIVLKGGDLPFTNGGSPALGQNIRSNLPSSVSASQLGTSTDFTSPSKYDPVSGSQASDVIDRGLLSMDVANELVASYLANLVQFFPVVALPEGTSAFELRNSKPVLFLAIIAATSLGVYPDLSNKLNEELIRVYADLIIVKGQKSLEMVQSLLITVLYYCPTDSAANLQFYQYTNMAVTMALDLGIGSKPRMDEYTASGNPGVKEDNLYSQELLEISRTILACYVMAAGLAMRMRRPNVLLFNNWMSECLGILEESPVFLDKHLAAGVKLQRIADETLMSFGLDDPSTDISLTDSRMQVILRGFERKMDDWMKATAPELMEVNMTTGHLQNSLGIYALAKDGNGAADFHDKYFRISPTRGIRIPFDLSAISSRAAPQEPHIPLSTAQINSTMKCVNSAHAILDTFLGMSINVMRQVPGVLYVRATNAIQTLMNISLTATESDLGEYMDIASLRLDFYFGRLLRHVEEASGPEQYKIPAHWLELLYKIKGLYDKHWIEVEQGQSRDDNASSAINQQSPEPSTTQLPTNDSQWGSILSAQSLYCPGGDSFSDPNLSFGDNFAATTLLQDRNAPSDEDQRRPPISFPGNFEPLGLSSVPMDSLDFDNNDLSFWDGSAANFNSWAETDVFGDMNFDTTDDNQGFGLE